MFSFKAVMFYGNWRIRQQDVKNVRKVEEGLTDLMK